MVTSYVTVVPLPLWATSRSGCPVGESSSLTKASPSGAVTPILVLVNYGVCTAGDSSMLDTSVESTVVVDEGVTT